MRKPLVPAEDERGMVALEFALLSPVFLLLIFGVMVFTIYFATLVAVTQASAEAARASVGGMSDTERGQLAQARAQQVFQSYSPLLSTSQASVTTGAGSSAGTFTVTVSYPVSNFGFGAYYALLSLIDSKAGGAPTAISHSETVADGGY